MMHCISPCDSAACEGIESGSKATKNGSLLMVCQKGVFGVKPGFIAYVFFDQRSHNNNLNDTEFIDIEPTAEESVAILYYFNCKHCRFNMYI